MRNRFKALHVLAALIAFLAPQAQAASGSPNWFKKHASHHNQKAQVHPERNTDKAQKRLEKAKQRSANMRERAAEQHPTPKK